MDGWMDGWESGFKDCLQQSKIYLHLNMRDFWQVPCYLKKVGKQCPRP